MSGPARKEGGTATASTCFVVMSHTVDDAFEDLVLSIRAFCPGADVGWYNSGPKAENRFGLRLIEPARPLAYGKITPGYFDVIEWASHQPYERVVTVETDMAFIRPGFLGFLDAALREADYLAPSLRVGTPAVSLWPAYRTLAAERAELSSILGSEVTHRGFSPAQVFGREFITAVLAADTYGRLRAFVEQNQQPGHSRTLQELLMPTLADSVGVRTAAYPRHLDRFNRYRPYQAPVDLDAALATEDAFFLHPVRRDHDDPVRVALRSLVRGSPPPAREADEAHSRALTAERVRSEAELRAAESERGADLRGTDLSGVMLRGVRLVEATLIDTRLRGTNLTGALLAGTDLRGADLSMSFLGGAFLGCVLLCEADLSGSYLCGADLHEADLRGAHLNGADLSGAHLSDAVLVAADLRHATLDGADLREADLGGACLEHASLRGTVLSRVRWTAATRWPAAEAGRVAAMSHETSSGVFVVSDDDSLAGRNHVQPPWT